MGISSKGFDQLDEQWVCEVRVEPVKTAALQLNKCLVKAGGAPEELVSWEVPEGGATKEDDNRKTR